MKMRFIWGAVLSALLFVSPAASAHDNDFKTPADLAKHVGRHIEEYRKLDAEKPRDENRINLLCREIEIHALSYLRFADQLVNNAESVQQAGAIRQLSQILLETAGRNDLPGSIKVLAQLKEQLK